MKCQDIAQYTDVYFKMEMIQKNYQQGMTIIFFFLDEIL